MTGLFNPAQFLIALFLFWLTWWTLRDGRTLPGKAHAGTIHRAVHPRLFWVLGVGIPLGLGILMLIDSFVGYL